MLLEKVALITSLLGVAALLFLSQQLEPKLVKISDINENLLGNNVRVQGKISEVKENEGMLIFSLKEDNSSITIIAYKNKQEVSIEKERLVEVTGRVKEFRNKVEIEAESIRIL